MRNEGTVEKQKLMNLRTVLSRLDFNLVILHKSKIEIAASPRMAELLAITLAA
jgi:hypothetical protein